MAFLNGIRNGVCDLARAVVGALVVSLAAALATPAQAQFSIHYEFIKAVDDGDFTEARTHLINGASPNARSYEGVPVLHLVLDKRNLDFARLLLEQGANVNATARDSGETPLMKLAAAGSEEGVRLVLAHGADVDREDRLGETSLMKAARAGQSGVAMLLLDAGADPEIEDYSGRTALQFAKNARSRAVVRLLQDAGARH